MERITLNASAQQHVAAYLEYRAIVGDADRGQLLTEAEYEVFKRKAIEARKNRIYVSWRNMNNGIDCKLIGPSSQCFCGHRYRDHATDNHKDKRIHCRTPGCKCQLFDYLPSHGTWTIKCLCKHEAVDHSPIGSKNCIKCRACSGFNSSFSCGCGDGYAVHSTVLETREERSASGRPVDNLAGGGAGYEAMGGITSFSSLADGYDRLDPSGIGYDGSGRKMLTPAAGFEPEAPMPSHGISRTGKVAEVDEMALYEQKYKKGGSMYSNVVKPGRRHPAPALENPFGGPQSSSSFGPVSTPVISAAAPLAVPRNLHSSSSSSSAIPRASSSSSGARIPQRYEPSEEDYDDQPLHRQTSVPYPAPASSNPLSSLKQKMGRRAATPPSAGSASYFEPQLIQRSSSSSSASISSARTRAMEPPPAVDPIAELEEKLQDASISEAQRYALKKKLQVEKANKLRAERAAAANASAGSGCY